MYIYYIQSFKIPARSVAEQAGLNLTWSKISEDTFSHDVAHMTVLNGTYGIKCFDNDFNKKHNVVTDDISCQMLYNVWSCEFYDMKLRH